MTDLSRADKIMKHPLFKEALDIIESCEESRKYCRHGLSHLMDTARIGLIIAGERNAGLKEDMIYAAALLHDLGRAGEYKNGTPHDQASVMYAHEILPECGYSSSETACIVMAIAAHRMECSGMQLAEILYEADKKSRLCFTCEAQDTCKWPYEKMNMELTY